MTLLVLGATGFIGAHVAAALRAAGFDVIAGTRPAMDLERDVTPEAWRPHLAGVDVVVNAAGIIRESRGRSFERVHARGPAALFAACAAAGVKVVQVSALGADDAAASAFHRSKKAADDALLALDVPSIVLQPSLVYGPGGASARLFGALASLPVVPLPADGAQPIQPIHVEDLARAVVAAVREDRFPRRRVALVGPRPVTLREFLAALRAGMGLGTPRFVRIPRRLIEAAARWRVGLLDADTWRMLERGNTADVADTARLLGAPPRPPEAFVAPADRALVRRAAKLPWLLGALRVAIAIVWLTAGVVSAGLFPVEDSLALLARTGLTGGAAYAALYGAALLDFVLGIATLAMRRRRTLWKLQAAVVLAYTAIITVALPEQWLHPYGPVVKNLPFLAALWLLHELEEDA